MDAVGEPVVRLRGITKTYHIGGEIEVHALQGIDLDIGPGELVAVMGASGSGKSTLMNILGCLDVADGGTYELAGIDVTSFSDDELAEIRNMHLGFVFQSFNLLPRLDALHNVELPLIYSGDGGSREERAAAALERVGLGGRIHHRPNEMSGGEQQRVAIARALLNDPTLILADEPTGNLDSRASLEIVGLFQSLNEAGKTIVCVTHEPDIAGHFRRIVRVRDGRIIEDERVRDPKDARAEIAPAPVAV